MLSKLWSPLPEPSVRRGGWRQRAAIDEAKRAACQSRMSRLAAGQLLRWSDGDLSAAKLLAIMKDADEDGLQHVMVSRLSGLPSGQHAQHSLLELLRSHTAVFDDIHKVVGVSSDHILKPSAMISRLYQHYPAKFVRVFGAQAGRVRSFWQQMFQSRNRKWLLEHHWLGALTLDELSHIVPLVLHEDAAPVTKLLSSNMISCSSLLAHGSEKENQLLIATFIKRKKAEAEDHSQLWREILQDFESLMVENTESRGPWRFLLFFSIGDEEVRCVEWGLVSYGAADECCSECTANRTSRPWTDMRRGAGWRGTDNFTIAQYRDRCRRPLHPLANSTFMWRFFFFLDIMHILDCKGVISTIAGSLILELTRDLRLGPNQQRRLDVVNQKLREFYRQNPGVHRLPKLKLQSLVGSDGWAQMAGPAIKAAQTRACVPFLSELANEYYTDATMHGRNIRKLFTLLKEFYVILDTTMFLNDNELGRLAEVVDDFGIALQALNHQASLANELRWKVQPKCHKMMHLPLFASILNPMSLNCYIRESQVGTSQHVWKSLVRGRYQDHVQRLVLAKRWLALLLRFEIDSVNES